MRWHLQHFSSNFRNFYYSCRFLFKFKFKFINFFKWILERRKQDRRTILVVIDSFIFSKFTIWKNLRNATNEKHTFVQPATKQKITSVSPFIDSIPKDSMKRLDCRITRFLIIYFVRFAWIFWLFFINIRHIALFRLPF